MFFRRAKLLNAIYPILKRLIQNAGFPNHNSLTDEINKEFKDAGETLIIGMNDIIFEVIQEVTWKNKNIIWKKKKYDAEQGALFSIAEYILNMAAGPGGLERIKEESPEMYNALDVLWHDVLIHHIKATNYSEKYMSLNLDYGNLDPFEVLEESETVEKIEESDEDDENLDVQDGEDDKGMEFLSKMADGYVENLKIFISLTPNQTPILSDYQIKFIFALQLFGAIDYCGQLKDIGQDKCSPLFTVKLLDQELFGWNPSEVGFVVSALGDVQEEQWAQKIIISGGESMAEIIDNSALFATNTMDESLDLFPMTKIYDDDEVMKLVAKNVQPPF